jgi:hypothetical protein
MATKANPTQDFVPIEEVRDGIIVLKGGGLRSLLLASSINLSLKSGEEQVATITQFQNFLNSLDFSVQIVVESRRLDIRPYLTLLENRMKEQVEPLLKVQTREYIEFIRQFTEQVSIMTKNFIIVVPFESAPLSATGSITKSLFGKKQPEQSQEKSDLQAFEEARSQLDQRVSVIEQGLSRVGVKTIQLGTEETIELFYKVFNPGEATAAIKTEH